MSSAAAIALAPMALPGEYSWVRHSISESAAQAQDGAWVARLFLIASLWYAAEAARSPRPGTADT